MTSETRPTFTYSPTQVLDRELNAVIDTALALNRIVGTVTLVALDGKVAYQRAAGFADRETRKLIQPDTIFRLASVTKPIISVAALALIEQGKLGLNDSLSNWIPEFRPRLPDGREPVITIHQLLTHTAGLTYRFLESEDGPYHQADVSDGMDQPGLCMAENLRRIASTPLLFEPGNSFQYSVALDVLGEVLARAENKSLPQIAAALVTEPLGMKDTAFTVQDRNRVAANYFDAVPAPARMRGVQLVPFPPGAGISFAPDRIFDSTSFPSAGAGMAGTAGDFLKLIETLRTGGTPVLKRQTVDTMLTNQIGDFMIDPEKPGWGFGFGASILKDPVIAQTPQSIGTYAWGGAYGHSWFVDPHLKLSVIAFTNTMPEGVRGVFPVAVRDAIYRALAA